MSNKSSSQPIDQENELLSESFIIRIWLEDIVENGSRVPWHGQITHVSSGDCKYIKDLKGLTEFLTYYLEKLGARISLDWRMRRWLKRE